MDSNTWSWAFSEKADAEILEQTIKDCNEYELSIVSTILKEIDSDSEDESVRILNLYKEADDTGKAIIDSLLVSLCGWTLKSIIEKSFNSQLDIEKVVVSSYDGFVVVKFINGKIAKFEGLSLCPDNIADYMSNKGYEKWDMFSDEVIQVI